MPDVIDLVLKPHPAMPPRAVQAVTVQIERDPGELRLLYIVEGDPGRIRLPRPQKPYRAEGLWQSTCFELFVHDGGPAYREFNFSPSSQWAAYGFPQYREGREELALNRPPQARLLEPEPFLIMLRAIAPIAPEPRTRIGVSAIIEETDGAKSYWALAHPAAEPDFHHPDSFALELPAGEVTP